MKNAENFKELINILEINNFAMSEYFIKLEACYLEKSVEEIRNLMLINFTEMKNSIKSGLEKTTLSYSGMSGNDSCKIQQRYTSNSKSPMNNLFGKLLNYSIAVMEENSRMGKIVACPTAGSCGILPAVVIAYAEELNIADDLVINSLFTAGGIGKIIAQQMPLSGAVAGCQAECGVSSAMAASAVTELLGGNNHQIINSSTLALKNVLGLTCDPVAGLVEVPCVKRNAFYSIHAVTASELSLSGVTSVIPADEVVSSMKQIGNLMSPLLKETSCAGLAVTPTAEIITTKIEKQDAKV
ncbi:MAG: L-serine ammonia-lyase, iron-sulfur-dependent, subunit alpha [bacterium]